MVSKFIFEYTSLEQGRGYLLLTLNTKEFYSHNWSVQSSLFSIIQDKNCINITVEHPHAEGLRSNWGCVGEADYGPWRLVWVSVWREVAGINSYSLSPTTPNHVPSYQPLLLVPILDTFIGNIYIHCAPYTKVQERQQPKNTNVYCYFWLHITSFTLYILT